MAQEVGRLHEGGRAIDCHFGFCLDSAGPVNQEIDAQCAPERIGVLPINESAFDRLCKRLGIAHELVVPLTPWHFDWWRPSGRCVTEEVEKVNPDLGNRDRDGKVQTVPDGAVDATFLKEFLRERRRVEELGTKIVRQQNQIEALTAALQKMSAQLELRETPNEKEISQRRAS